MNFEEIAAEYEMEFGVQPPILTTLSTDNELYLQELKNAITRGKPIDRDYLGSIFMTDNDAFY